MARNKLFKVTIQEDNGDIREYAQIATCKGKAKLEVGLFRTQNFPDMYFNIIKVEAM